MGGGGGGGGIVSQKGPGVGFKILDQDGNFDIDHKRLANVASPESEHDAVVKEYVDVGINHIKRQLENNKTVLNRTLVKFQQVNDALKALQDINENNLSKLEDDVNVRVDSNQVEIDNSKRGLEIIKGTLSEIEEKCDVKFNIQFSEIRHLQSFVERLESKLKNKEDENGFEQFASATSALLSRLEDRVAKLENKT